MISVYTAEGGGAWIDAVAVDPDERRRLSTEHAIPEDFVAHALDADERPRVQRADGATLIVVRAPVAGVVEQRLATVPLGLVLLPDRVATICAQDHPVLARLRRFAQAEWSNGHRHRLILHALEVIAEAFIEQLREIDARVDRLEVQLQVSLENREVIGLLHCQKSLSQYTAALRGMDVVLSRLRQCAPEFQIPPEDQPLLEETLVEIRQAIDMTDLAEGMLAQMMDAFASMISNNLNVVMKRMTATAVVLTFPVMIASFWGMNVPVPGHRSASALGILVAASALLSLVVVLVFRRLRWL